MSFESCYLCHRNAFRDRWIGDLHALVCDMCGAIYLCHRTPRAAPVTVPVVPPVQRGWPHVALAARLRG